MMSCKGCIPADVRVRKAVWLLATWFFGSIIMALTSGEILLSTSVDSYATPLALNYGAVRDAYLMAWMFCAPGLAVVALLCFWRRSRGHVTWAYGAAVGLTFLAMMVIWLVPGFTMGFTSSNTGGTLLGNLGMGLGMWLLSSVYALFFNLVNLPLVVPAIIDAWYTVLNRDTPAQEPAGVACKRRWWLYGLTFLAIVLLACTSL